MKINWRTALGGAVSSIYTACVNVGLLQHLGFPDMVKLGLLLVSVLVSCVVVVGHLARCDASEEVQEREESPH